MQTIISIGSVKYLEIPKPLMERKTLFEENLLTLKKMIVTTKLSAQ